MLYRFVATGAALMMSAAAGTSDAAERPLKVFVCAGQSNMVGTRARASELPASMRAAQRNVLFFDGKAWVPMAPGKTERKGFGPEISFGHRMAAAIREPVGIIKHSVGGTDLARQWSPKNKSSLYAALLRKVKAAQKSRRIEIIGFLWMQGERDSREKAKAEAYAKNLAGLVRAARKDYSAPRMLFVSGRVNPPEGVYKYVGLVRKAQEQCAEPGYAYIDCDSLSKGSDNLHYDTKGLVEMGNRFAAAITKLATGK